MNYIPDESFAAVDLGSNSFHMIVANYSEDRLQVIDRLKEMVRLASGLDNNNCLTDESMERAINCLERLGQRIKEIPRVNVRAVGTNTLRKARNGEEFLARAHTALGHPIEIISGREEARLIFLGIGHTTYNEEEKRLAIDIGGGSTEVIIGRCFQPYYMESLYMGCVNISQRFFHDGEVTGKRMKKAILFARQELETVQATYKKAGWDSAIGSSGTIHTINDIIKAQGWSDANISKSALWDLKDALITLGNTDKFQYPELSDGRRPVFIGGVAILCAVFEALEIKSMQVSDGALREGLLHDLIGRIHHEDIRDKTIDEFMQGYKVDIDQSERVTQTVEILFDAVQKKWQLNVNTDLKLLRWAARMHEVGMSIAHAQHHYHSAYLLSNSDMPGFSHQEQLDLSMLVRAHRRKFPAEEIRKFKEKETTRIRRLCVLLRIAVLLNRSRSYTSLPNITVNAGENDLELIFPKNWLDSYPLTQADITTEAELLQVIDFELRYA